MPNGLIPSACAINGPGNSGGRDEHLMSHNDLIRSVEPNRKSWPPNFLLSDTVRLPPSRTFVASLPLLDLVMRQYLHGVFAIHIASPAPNCCSGNNISMMTLR